MVIVFFISLNQLLLFSWTSEGSAATRTVEAVTSGLAAWSSTGWIVNFGFSSSEEELMDDHRISVSSDLDGVSLLAHFFDATSNVVGPFD